MLQANHNKLFENLEQRLLSLSSYKQRLLVQALRVLMPGMPRFNPYNMVTEEAKQEFADAYANYDLLRNESFKLSFDEFASKLVNLIRKDILSSGSRQFLNFLLPSLEMFAPETLTELVFFLRTSDSKSVSGKLSCADIEEYRLKLAAASESQTFKPIFHPSPSSGWMNDIHGVLIYPDNSMLFHYQLNPFAPAWGNIAWGRFSISTAGQFQDLPCVLFPYDVAHENAAQKKYDHYFSGSIFTDAVSNNSETVRRFAFISGVAAEKTFYDQADTLLTFSDELDCATWSERFQITDRNTFKHAYDQIKKRTIPNIYEVRDPNVVKINGQILMVLAGTLKTRRRGGGVILMLKPSSADLTKPWKFFGTLYEDPIAFNKGGAGIIECPRIEEFISSDSQRRVLLLFSAQRRKRGGKLSVLNSTEAVVGIIGNFDPQTGTFEKLKEEVLDFNSSNEVYASTCATNSSGKLFLFHWLKVPGDGKSWSGAASVRRLDYIDGYGFWHSPPEYFEKLPRKIIWQQSVAILSQTTSLPVMSSSFDLSVKINLSNRSFAGVRVLGATNWRESLDIICSQDGIQVRASELRSVSSRSLAKKKRKYFTTQNFPVRPNKNASFELRIIVDRRIVEIYANGKVFTYIYRGEVLNEGIALLVESGEAQFSDFEISEVFRGQ